MKGELFLVNYYHSKCEPSKSITQLPKEEAFAVAKKIYDENPCRAHRRFGLDFQWYYPHRLKTEKWLYDNFIKVGGIPKLEHPYYFALQYCESLYLSFDYGKHIMLSLSEIAEDDISFTFGDSVAVMDSIDRKEPFTKTELLNNISLFNNDIDKFLESIKEKYAYIEAQVWTDKYFKS